MEALSTRPVDWKRYTDGVEVGVVPPAEHAFSFVLSINLDRNI